jgi:hypothetical protein
LLQNGADFFALNCEGELAVDVVATEDARRRLMAAEDWQPELKQKVGNSAN